MPNDKRLNDVEWELNELKEKHRLLQEEVENLRRDREEFKRAYRVLYESHQGQ